MYLKTVCLFFFWGGGWVEGCVQNFSLFLISEPIRPEGSPFGRFLVAKCYELK